ncbi:MAG TPA: hypothetical protein VHS30_15245, partial [Streptosporangiaceae bacterium]|nr:hypothetical protein [Streptosporangiaceae bacterium]
AGYLHIPEGRMAAQDTTERTGNETPRALRYSRECHSPPQPELTVFELGEGGYALVAKASGPFAADRPFRVSIDLAELTRGLPRCPAWPSHEARTRQADPSG